MTPDDIGEQRKALRAEKSAAMRKLLDGELSQEEYQAVEDTVQDQLDALLTAQATDRATGEMLRNAMMADYGSELRAAHKAAREAGLPDLGKPGTAIGQEFDRAVRMFANEATARGLADLPGNLAASKDALAEATAYVLRRHGKAVPAGAMGAVGAGPATAPPVAAGASAAPAASATSAAPARTARPVDRSQFPPTLANVPTAADATIASEFAHLDGMDGADLERALARMTPEQQDRYLG